ncbi:1-acyl-sn-glycerol-3-phosphate acyltransferase [Thermoactinomyces sp. DSM 45892]|uniref:lysophospholipid acyltransferase family protein n=1 Tax=Thermoactinomyces sp. DSM 45892 TaxID=1882753 RepID=UPI0015A4C0FF|nr:lysophospholipid acyltransferase family protein [Thermoactinomyces sp. DSM 45892]
MYKLLRFLITLIYRIFFPYEVIGVETFPKSGGAVVSPNHISNLDPPLLGISLPRQVHFMAKEEMFRVSIIKKALYIVGTFPVKRGGGDSQALKASIRILREGKVLGIFPQGTRDKSGEIRKVHVGAAMFALRTNSPLVPVAIIGPYRLFRKVRIVYGKPILPAEYLVDGKSTSDGVDRLSARWKKEVESLLHQYR